MSKHTEEQVSVYARFLENRHDLPDAVAFLRAYADLLAVQENAEPDCYAALTPNGSKLVSPEEAKGLLQAYPLFTHPPAQAWIPVRERLPDGNQEVLVFPGWATGGERPHIEQYSAQYKCFLMEIEDGKRVTHWQPLPPAPQGE